MIPIEQASTKRWRTNYPSRPGTGRSCDASRLAAEHLQQVREIMPFAYPAERAPVARLRRLIEGSLRGCSIKQPERSPVPSWLLPHQRGAYRRLRAAIDWYGGAIHADAVGLGKTFVALAIAREHPRSVVICPATMRTQWERRAHQLHVPVSVITMESLSRNCSFDPTPLVIVDEAHHFRNPSIVRTQRLARLVSGSRTLLLTATPIVNRASDLIELIRLFAADDSLSLLGVRSIEHEEDPAFLWNAARSLIVSRNEVRGAQLPRPTDREFRCYPLDADLVGHIVACLETLRFPDLPQSHANLLRSHLVNRLCSSHRAFARSIRRHVRFATRAIDAAEAGQVVARRSLAAQIENELSTEQLDFLMQLDRTPSVRLESANLRKERDTLTRILHLLEGPSQYPKLDALARALVGEKSLVFCAATATASWLAEQLGWRRIGLVTGAGARIASGEISRDDVFDMFAPTARDARRSDLTELDALIATDVAAEGLDLQDATQVVHFDLPWTPHRLTQRLGRIARIGSRNAQVTTTWLLPPGNLERRARIPEILARKAGIQLTSAVPVSSKPGKSLLANTVQQRREEMIERGLDPIDQSGIRVVRGPRLGVVVIEWSRSTTVLWDVVAISSQGFTNDIGAIDANLASLDNRPELDVGPPAWARSAVRSLLKHRIGLCSRLPAHPRRQKLVGITTAMGRAAGRLRDRALLARLDRVLTCLDSGLSKGVELLLEDWLEGPGDPWELDAILDRVEPSEDPIPRIKFLLAGEAAGP